MSYDWWGGDKSRSTDLSGFVGKSSSTNKEINKSLETTMSAPMGKVATSQALGKISPETATKAGLAARGFAANVAARAGQALPGVAATSGFVGNLTKSLLEDPQNVDWKSLSIEAIGTFAGASVLGLPGALIGSYVDDVYDYLSGKYADWKDFREISGAESVDAALEGFFGEIDAMAESLGREARGGGGGGDTGGGYGDSPTEGMGSNDTDW